MIKSRIKEIWNEIDRLAEDEEPKALRDSIGEILNGVELSTSVRTPADLATRMAKLASGTNLLDFGCGRGPHRELLERSGFTWTGLEYGSSNAPGMIGVSQSKQISFYDGKRIPFEECSFDAIWSWQALEHVPEPDMALSEISRVLKHTTGVFAGSVSFLEPYHPWSTFGYSPYGLYVILKKHGFRLLALYPGPDVITMALRYLHLYTGHQLSDEDAGILALPSDMEAHLRIHQRDTRHMAGVLLQLSACIRFLAVKE